VSCFRIPSEAASWQVEVQTTSNPMREVCESLEYPQKEGKETAEMAGLFDHLFFVPLLFHSSP
jgi:hypothetical protein